MDEVYSYRFPRVSDGMLARGFLALAQECPDLKALTVTGAAQSPVGQVNIPEQDNAQWQALVKRDGYFIDHIQFRIGNHQIDYHRGCRPQGAQLRSQVFDEFIVRRRGADDGQGAGIVVALHTAFPPPDPIKLLSAEASDSAAELRALLQSGVQRLQDLMAEVTRSGLEYQRGVDLATDAKRKQLAAEFDSAKAELREAARQKEEALARQSEELDALRRSLDDRNNTHARRQIRDQMLDDVKARIASFSVSKETRQQRTPISVLLASATIVLTCVLLFTFWELWTFETGMGRTIIATAVDNLRSGKNFDPNALVTLYPSSQRWALWGRAVILSAGLAGALLYYVRWHKSWADLHAQVEFNLQQFYIDVNRANWVVETCLEWSKETATAIPAPLLESLARGLFASTEPSVDKVLHPADELASALLGSASKLKLKIGDSELELNKPGKGIPKEIKLPSDAHPERDA